MTRKNLISSELPPVRHLRWIRHGLRKTMWYAHILLLGGVACAGATDLRLPENEIVVSGAVSIERSAGQLTITQTTDKGIINWGSFDIGADAKVNFLQPNSSSSTLNRISSGLPTSILGQLTANGKIFVLNSGGVLVGGGARVNVGSLVMSTLQIADQDFLSEQYVLARGEHDGGITNEGSIVGDQVALVSPRILNRGTIDAKSDVVFASGDLVELSITNNNTIVLRMNASAVDSLIDNQGSINAGRVTFKANAMQAIVDSTINLPRSANTIVSENGVLTLVESSGTVIAQQIDLDAGERGGVRVSGVLNGSSAAGDGGQISVTGEEVTVARSAVISANGFTGGGVILMGGDWQGQGNAREATFTTIESGAELSANATHTGDGGTIVAWSDVANENSVTKAQGQFAVIGGEEQGSGGRVETSGHRLVLDEVAVNATAPNGKTGQWLIDPVDFTIAASGGDITGTTLGTNLSSADVTILSSSGASGSDGDINVNDAVSWSANTLTLNASGDININSNLLGSGSAKLALLYGQGAVSSGNTSDYTIAKTDAGFSAKVDLPDGANFSTKLGSDGSTVSYTVISSLDFADTGNFAFGTNITDAGSYSRGVKNSFSGNIDGLGHTIDGLTIYHPVGAPGRDTGDTGFFSGYYTATGITADIANLGLTNMSQTSIRGFAGAFIGRCRTNCSATIKNSYATGVITNSTGNALGGIVGAVDGTLNIKNSFSNVAVTGYGTRYANTNEGVGGLIGRTGLSATVSIINSHNLGSVTGTSNWTGGLIGYSYGVPTITSSYNAGSVSGVNYTGGLIGYTESALTLTSIYNTGAINGQYSVGGLVGYASDSNTLTSSYNTGTVSGTAGYYSAGAAKYIGGLVGYAGAAQTISSSYNTGAITDSTGTYGYVGGLVGNLSSSSASTIQGSYNTGSIYGGYDVGGLVGAASSASISTSFNTGTVTGFWCHGGNCNNPGGVGGLLGSNRTARYGTTYVTISESYNEGTIKGPTAVGGLVGQGWNNTITDSYNKGNVSGSFSYNGQGVSTWLTNYNGGIVGRTDGGTTLTRVYNSGKRVNQDDSTSYVGVHGAFIGTKTDVFYLQASTGTASGGQRALSSSDMQTLSNFTNYDSSTWTTSSSLNSGYPLLLNNTTATVVTFTASSLSRTYGTAVDASSFLGNGYYTVSGATLAEAFSANPSFTIYSGSTQVTDTTPDAGSYTITPSGGTLNSGYLLSYVNGTLTVNQKALTGSMSVADKTYDGATTATATVTLSGLIGSETLSNTVAATFDTKNVGTSKTVTLNSLTLADGSNGGLASNYSFSTGQTGTAAIAQLSSVTWTGGAGDGLWSSASNWTNSAIPDGSNVATAVISSSSDSVTFDAASVGTIPSTIINNIGALTINAASDFTMANTITGGGSIVKTGNGTLTLSGSNTYTGSTTISSGVLKLSSASALGTSYGTSTGTSSVTVSSGAALDFSGTTVTREAALSIAGTGVSSSGALFNGSSSAATYAGNISLAADATVKATSGNITLSGVVSGSNGLTKTGTNQLTLSGSNTYTGATTVNAGVLNITGLLGSGTYANTISNSGTLKFGTSANQTVSGVISGAGALTKTGLKQLVLSGENSSMSGAVTVVAGTIQLGHASAFGDGTNTVTVESGANVDLNGKSISNNFEIAGTGDNAGAIGNTSTTGVTLSGNITLQGTTNLIKSSGDLTFGGTIRGTSGEDNPLTISAASKDVTLNGLIGSDAYNLTSAGSVNPYALTITAENIYINNNITTDQSQTYNGNILVGGNQTGSSGTERILLSLNPSITISGNISDQSTGAHSLSLRAVRNQLSGDEASITVAGTSTTNTLDVLELVAMYDPTPATGFGVLPGNEGTSPYYTGTVNVTGDVKVSSTLKIAGQTIDLNATTVTAGTSVKIYGYSSVNAGAIALSDNSEIDRDNFADASLVAGITFATVSSSSNSSSSASSDEAVRRVSNVISKISTKIPGMRGGSSNMRAAPALARAAPVVRAGGQFSVEVGPVEVSGPAPAPRVAPQQAAPQQAAPQQAGPQQAGPQQAGPQRAGPQQAGPQQAGPQQAGPQQAGPQQAGPQQAGPQQAGPQQGGPQQGGPQQGGPDQGGPDQGGPDQGGPDQGGPESGSSDGGAEATSDNGGESAESSGNDSSGESEGGEESEEGESSEDETQEDNGEQGDASN